jgi:hypothetical protein
MPFEAHSWLSEVCVVYSVMIMGASIVQEHYRVVSRFTHVHLLRSSCSRYSDMPSDQKIVSIASYSVCSLAAVLGGLLFLLLSGCG